MISEEVAINVSKVSKAYRLFGSPNERLSYPFRKLLSALRGKKLPPAEEVRQFFALQDVSFQIKKGESWGFVGFNGSGKSTLLKILSGNLKPTTGFVEVCGKVAILDYSSGFNQDFTGRENVYLKGALLGIGRKDIDKRFSEIEAFADIGSFIDQPVKTYSSGMVARLGFAIMTHVDADTLITDEALAVGDAFFIQKCMRHIKEFLKKGTFLFVSHSINDVMALCDHAVWLDQGRVLKVGSAKDVCQAYLASVEKKKSESFLNVSEAAKHEFCSPANNDAVSRVAYCENCAPEGRRKIIMFSALELASLKDYYAPAREGKDVARMSAAQISIQNNFVLSESGMYGEGAVGGGRIFSVSIVDEEARPLETVVGGEVVVLSVRAVAERRILNPILGFQIKNSMGLSLVAENTFYATRNSPVLLEPKEVLSAVFRFEMPLFPIGDYVIRVGLADGVEDNNALIDVIHEALVFKSVTSGARHGLVGVPLFGLEVRREYPVGLSQSLE
ncbi:MAG: transporter ATP-binding protein [Rhodocyclales bacterium]|nr:transporter ATP-binding protein [Rhodocyclales bacterium]